jgi:uncharacterized damage-inducible protein DinB
VDGRWKRGPPGAAVYLAGPRRCSPFNYDRLKKRVGKEIAVGIGPGVSTMYAYNRWANERTLDAVSPLTSEQFTRTVGGSFGSLRDTLVHILSAEWIWLERCRGRSPKAMLSPTDFPDVASLRSRWGQVSAEQREFYDAIAPEDLSKIVTYVNTKGETWSYPLEEVLWHVVNHGSYHRGQVTTALRQLGVAPAATDFLLFRDRASDRS